MSEFFIFLIFSQDSFDEDTRLRKCAEAFRSHLEHINRMIGNEVQDCLNHAVDNCLAGKF